MGEKASGVDIPEGVASMVGVGGSGSVESVFGSDSVFVMVGVWVVVWVVVDVSATVLVGSSVGVLEGLSGLLVGESVGESWPVSVELSWRLLSGTGFVGNPASSPCTTSSGPCFDSDTPSLSCVCTCLLMMP